MERNIINNKIPEQFQFYDLSEQNNIHKENYFSQDKNYFNKQNHKHASPLQYNIEVNIKQKRNSKNKKQLNNFKKTRNKNDMFVKNTNESIELNNNKENDYKINYEMNDYFIKGYNEKKKRKKNSKNKFKNNKEKNKFLKSDSSSNNLAYKSINNTFDSKKFKSNKNLGLQLTLKTSSELSKINKNKLLLSSSNNLKEYTNKTTNNITSNFTQTINTHNISIKLPFEESMKNEILDILNLNNNIKINQNEFNTLQNIAHSSSTKSFSFNKRKKPFIKSPNYLTDDIIDNILKSNDNEFNKKEEENKIKKLEKEINKIKEEYIRIKEEKNNLEMSNMIMQNEMRYFYKQKEIEKNNFEIYKQNEIKKIAEEKNKLEKDVNSLNELKKKFEKKNMSSDKSNGKSDIIKKDNELIEIYKNKLDEANKEILKLKTIIQNLNINYNKEYNKNITEKQFLNKEIKREKNEEKKLLEEYEDESEDNEDDNYDMILPDKYHKINYQLIKSEKNNEGSVIKTYNKNKVEITLINGDRKEIYDDKYEIIYYFNGDIKQIFKDKNKQVFYFKNQKITKTTLGKGLQIIKYNDSNQLEKIFPNGTKKISFSDGRLKYILPNGLQETYFPDGSVERKLKDGNIILECGEGTKS